MGAIAVTPPEPAVTEEGAPDAWSTPHLEGLAAAALAGVSNSVFITDRDGQILWVNDAFSRITGYAPEEAIGQNPRLLRSGRQDRSHYEQLWSTVLAGRVWRGEVVNRRRDGSLYTAVQSITPIRDEPDGEVAYFIAVHDDVTELRSNQARLRMLFRHSLDAILLVDDRGRIVDANPAAEALTARDSGRLIGQHLVELVSPGRRLALQEDLATLRTSGGVQGETVLDSPARSDDAGVEVEYSGVAHIDPGIHLLAFRDVTEGRAAARDLAFRAQLLDAVGDAIVATDLDGTVRYVNPAVARLTGWSYAELAEGATRRLLAALPRRSLAEVLLRIRRGSAWQGEVELTNREGGHIPVLLNAAPYRDPDGRVDGVIAVASDISTLRTTQTQLSARMAQQTAVAELGRLALGARSRASAADDAARLVSDHLGADWFDVQVEWSAPHPGRLPPKGGALPAGEVVVPIGDRGRLIVRSLGQHRLDDQDRLFLGSVAHLLHAVAERQSAELQLEHLATRDALTGLANRTALLDRLEQAHAAAGRTGHRVAVLMLGLDGFALVNDALGHDTGDETLRLVARRLERLLPPGCSAARVGGDEFAVVLPAITAQAEALGLASRLQATVRTLRLEDRQEVTLTASVGVAVDGDGLEASALLREAGAAMHRAKAQGRNRIELADEQLQVAAAHRLDVASAIRSALDDGRVVAHYQPVVDLASGRVVGLEALARLRQPDGSLLAPGAFIEVAEAAGLIGELGEQVLRLACADLARWRRGQPDLWMAVNVAARQLMAPTLPATVAGILEEYGLPPAALSLELTETALLDQPGVHAAMRQLRQLGVTFAIDDFGTGYSSLAYLRQMPAQKLKIDRSFVSGLTTHDRDRALVTATVELAHVFGLETVAEGVETPEHRAALVALGCDQGQGYLWSPPVPAEQVEGLLTRAPGPSGAR